jgi:predicted DNA-binding protein (UPF0251 family)
MKNAKSRQKTRLDKGMNIFSNNTWQGCMSVRITFDELEKVDLNDIRGLLNQGETSEEKDIL